MTEKIYRKYSGFPDHPGKRRLPIWPVTLTTHLAFRLFFRVRVEGLKRIPKSGPGLVSARHQRLMDIPPGLTHAILAARKDVWCVMKDTPGGVGGFLLKCGGIRLNRQNPEKSEASLLMARELLHGGQLIRLFPEQTYYPARMGRG